MPPRSEKQFLAAYDPAAFDRPSIAVDAVLLTVADGALQALLVERDEHPFRGRLALPGGFVRIDESLDDAARRVLREKAGLRSVFLEQLHAFGAPKRDPRMRIVSVAYFALVAPGRLQGQRLTRLPAEKKLAFDHAEILARAVERLRARADAAALQLLPARFTLLELRGIHEAIAGRALNKDSFRRRMIASGLVEPTGELRRDLHRPAELYRQARR